VTKTLIADVASKAVTSTWLLTGSTVRSWLVSRRVKFVASVFTRLKDKVLVPVDVQVSVVALGNVTSNAREDATRERMTA